MRDWPIVMGGVTLIVVVVMVINLLVDISYAFLDRASALAVRRISLREVRLMQETDSQSQEQLPPPSRICSRQVPHAVGRRF